MSDQPNYVPAHKLPCWLSSEDVKEEIRKLADTGTDKAACWDFMVAIHRLAEKQVARVLPEKCSVCLIHNPPLGGCSRNRLNGLECPYRAVAYAETTPIAHQEQETA